MIEKAVGVFSISSEDCSISGKNVRNRTDQVRDAELPSSGLTGRCTSEEAAEPVVYRLLQVILAAQISLDRQHGNVAEKEFGSVPIPSHSYGIALRRFAGNRVSELFQLNPLGAPTNDIPNDIRRSLTPRRPGPAHRAEDSAHRYLRKVPGRFCVSERYSCRKACTGWIREARRAGAQPASMAAASNNKPAAASVIGSVGLIP